MIEVSSVTHFGYCIIVTGNGGEEELVIQTSLGQSGGWAMQAIATSCDGGRADGKRPHWDMPYTKMDVNSMAHKIRELVIEWGSNQEGANAVAQQFGKIYSD